MLQFELHVTFLLISNEIYGLNYKQIIAKRHDFF